MSILGLGQDMPLKVTGNAARAITENEETVTLANETTAVDTKKAP
jgi:hypothetical protein